MRRLAAALIAMAATALAVPAARSQPVSFPELEAAVDGAPKSTYLDLVRMVLPDIAPAGAGYAGTKIGHVREFEPQNSGAAPERYAIANVAVLPVEAQGRPRLLLLLDLGQTAESAEGYAVLALYDVSGAPKLLDAVNVGFDRMTYFRDPGALAVAEGTVLVTTMSMHFNSNQNYVTSALVLPRDDRLALVDSIFTFDDTACSYGRRQELALSADPKGAEPGAFTAAVTETTTPSGADCGDETPPPPGARTISVTYAWDAGTGRYRPDSDALAKLAAEDETRF